jgi:hypothetical protein
MSFPRKPSAVCYAAQPEGGHSEAGERGFDALLAMRQAEAIVKALKIGRYEIKRIAR